MSAPSQSSDDEHVLLADTLRRTGQCVYGLGQKVLHLERQFLDHHTPIGNLAEATQGLQAIDFLKQATDDIAALLDRLADAMPSSPTMVRAEVFEQMKLQELRDVIGSACPKSEKEGILRSNKEIELF